MMMRWLLALVLLLPSLPLAAADAVVARRHIRAAEIIAAADLELLPIDSAGAVAAISDVVGREARVMLYAGRPIRPEQLGAPTIVSRNQPVVLIYQSPALRIEAEGRAMDRGGIGDEIRVMNLSSRRLVLGEIRADGSVQVKGRGG